MFHGLAPLQGDQIASYIRSLTTPSPGRPWNPPYQPGPGLDSKPVEQWSAGAGLDAVPDTDQDGVNKMFPSGIYNGALSADGNMNVRETAIPMQLLDWNSWLPTTHPLDAWSDFATSRFFSFYGQLRTDLRYGDPVAYANNTSLFKVWKGEMNTFMGVGNKNVQPSTSTTVDLTFWTPDRISAVYSVPLWALVKSWELNQEFGLEGMARSVFTNPQADPRAWYTSFAFGASPNWMHIPRGIPGLENGRESTFVYLAMVWYSTQLVLNNSNKEQDDTSPIDWQYVYGFIGELAGLSPGQTTVHTLWRTKASQISNNGHEPDASSYRWQWMINEPLSWVYQGPATMGIWTGTSSASHAAILEGLTRGLVDSVKKFTPSQFYAGNAADPNVAPLRGNPAGNFSDRLWYAIPLLRYYGVSQGLINEFADWAKTVWPLGNWDLLKTDVCLASTVGVTCGTYH